MPSVRMLMEFENGGKAYHTGQVVEVTSYLHEAATYKFHSGGRQICEFVGSDESKSQDKLPVQPTSIFNELIGGTQNPTPEALMKYSHRVLRPIAAENHIVNYSHMNKQQLVEALLALFYETKS